MRLLAQLDRRWQHYVFTRALPLWLYITRRAYGDRLRLKHENRLLKRRLDERGISYSDVERQCEKLPRC